MFSVDDDGASFIRVGDSLDSSLDAASAAPAGLVAIECS